MYTANVERIFAHTQLVQTLSPLKSDSDVGALRSDEEWTRGNLVLSCYCLLHAPGDSLQSSSFCICKMGLHSNLSRLSCSPPLFFWQHKGCALICYCCSHRHQLGHCHQMLLLIKSLLFYSSIKLGSQRLG